MYNAVAERSIREVAMQLLEASGGAFDLYSVFSGNRLGLFTALDELGPATAADLSSATGLSEPHIREWLSTQVENGFAFRAGGAAGVRYTLVPAVRRALLDRDAIEALAPRDCYRVIPPGVLPGSHRSHDVVAA